MTEQPSAYELAASMRDHQLMAFVVTPDRSRGYIADPFGFAVELNPEGRRAVRELWERQPARRSAFGEEPPVEWAAEEQEASS